MTVDEYTIDKAMDCKVACWQVVLKYYIEDAEVVAVLCSKQERCPNSASSECLMRAQRNSVIP